MKSTLFSCLAATLLLLSLQSLAEAPGKDNSKAMLSEQPVNKDSLIRQAKSLEEQLNTIQTKALEANPQLTEQRSAIDQLIYDIMKSMGTDPEADQKKLIKIAEKARNPKLDKEEQKRLAQEFNSIQTKLQNSQQQAMQDPKVQENQQAFIKNLLDAMKSQDSNTKQLLDDLEFIMRQLQAMEMRDHEMQQGQVPPPPG